MSGLPVLTLRGSPAEQGREHGRRLRERISRNLEVYLDRFREEGGLAPGEVRARASAYLEAIARRNPDYAENLRGLTEGSGLAAWELAALNVRYEILYHELSRNAAAESDGCTAFGIPPERSASGHLLLGQNWDWVPEVCGAVLRTVEPDGTATVSFTEAGIAGGKIGLNSSGLGLGINGLHSTADDWTSLRTPFHVRCYEILRARRFEDALGIVTGEPRACSTNFLIAQAPARLADLEAAPETFRRLVADGGRIVHTNHFLDPVPPGVREPPMEQRPHSEQRLRRFRELLETREKIGLADLEGFLRDHEGHPSSVCRHENPADPAGERYATVTSVIMDLEERFFELTDGRPCEGKYRRVRLPGDDAGESGEDDAGF